MEVFETEREEISASEVPADIRRKIESRTKKFSSIIYFPSAEDSAEMICDRANKHYYGLNNYELDKSRAFELYIKAAVKGHSGAKNALKTLYNYDY